jgi:hypothetical protein
MEVASPPPVPFGHGNNRAKRHFSGSPGFVDSTNRNPFIADSSDEYMQHRSFKRRRFTSSDESMGADTENNQNHSFMQFQQQPIVAKGHSISLSTQGRSSNRVFTSPGFPRCDVVDVWPVWGNLFLANPNGVFDRMLVALMIPAFTSGY